MAGKVGFQKTLLAIAAALLLEPVAKAGADFEGLVFLDANGDGVKGTDARSFSQRTTAPIVWPNGARGS